MSVSESYQLVFFTSYYFQVFLLTYSWYIILILAVVPLNLKEGSQFDSWFNRFEMISDISSQWHKTLIKCAL